MVALAVVIAIVIAGNSSVVAKGFGGYDQVSSAEDLKQARGVVVHALADTVPGDRVISGEWTIKYHVPCAKAKLHNIEFDMAFAMMKPDGGGSHSHQFSDFSATGVTLEGDDLTIDGTITGTGPIGTDEITIRLVDIADGNASFFFNMDDGTLSGPPNVIFSEVGGAIIESK